MPPASGPGVPGVPTCAEGSLGTPGGVVCRSPVGRLTTTTGVTHPPSSAPNKKRHTQDWRTDRIETSRRAAKSETCSRCGAELLVGPDDDACAVTARVDPAPATLIEEVAARLAGRSSCELIHGRLYHRDEITIHAGRDEYPILLDHKCEMAVLF